MPASLVHPSPARISSAYSGIAGFLSIVPGPEISRRPVEVSAAHVVLTGQEYPAVPWKFQRPSRWPWAAVSTRQEAERAQELPGRAAPPSVSSSPSPACFCPLARGLEHLRALLLCNVPVFSSCDRGRRGDRGFHQHRQGGAPLRRALSVGACFSSQGHRDGRSHPRLEKQCVGSIAPGGLSHSWVAQASLRDSALHRAHVARGWHRLANVPYGCPAARQKASREPTCRPAIDNGPVSISFEFEQLLSLLKTEQSHLSEEAARFKTSKGFLFKETICSRLNRLLVHVYQALTGNTLGSEQIISLKLYVFLVW